MSESFLKIESVSKSFGNTIALDNVSLDINKSELFSLLGSSGCGKSTLLRIIAGFEKPDSGKIYLDGEDITSLPPYLRPLNIMFQNYALFPHLNVKKNIEFGLKEENLENDEINHRVKEITALLELTGLESRKINEISGGQQQRVALARCLVKKPKLLLLDEPLAALDKKLRVQTQFELVNLQYKLGITFIIVTHDQEEAMSLSDRMAIMKEGNILQIGNPVEIYEKPSNKYVANFIGTANLFQLDKITDNSDLLPNIKTDLKKRTLQHIGRRVSEQFRRYKISFTPYDLRHAWAVRTILIGLPNTVAAKMMGHSVSIHTKTYHHWITRRDQQLAVDSALSRGTY